MAKAGGPDPLERALDALYGAEYLLVCIGPDFTDGGASPLNSDLCTPGLIAKPDQFMGFWGDLYNKYLEKSPHDGFINLKRWESQLFSAKGDDVRKRKPNKKKVEDEGEEGGRSVANPRCYVVTGSIDSFVTRVGFEPEQVYEMVGSVTQWQCGTPCRQEYWTVSKSFRFEIDPTNHEAAPIKYVPDDKAAPQLAMYYVSDDEDLDPSQDPSRPAKPGTAPAAAKHLAIRLGRATSIRISPEFEGTLDMPPDPFPHPYPTCEGEYMPTFSWSEQPPASRGNPRRSVAQATPEDANAARAMRSGGGASDDEGAEPGGDEDEEGGGGGRSKGGQKYLPMPQFSHVEQHVRALVNEEHTYYEGVFEKCVDPQKALELRKQYYSSVQPFYNHDDPKNALFVRSRLQYVWYSISVFIIDLDKKMPDLTAPLPPGFKQGDGGRFFFNFLQARNTFQEPTKKRFIDVVRVPFPHTPHANGKKGSDTSVNTDTGNPVAPSTILPANCKISAVIEMLVGPKEFQKQKECTEAAVTNPFRRLCRQLVGKLSPPEPPAEKAAAPTQTSSHVTIVQSTEERLQEHVLETSERTLDSMKIGVPQRNPREVRYMEWEVVCCDEAAPTESHDIATVRRHEAAHAQPSSLYEPRKRGHKASVPRPTTNHQLCAFCHSVARPRVQMSAKDPALVPFSKKPYQMWEKWVMEQMKLGDANKFVIIELGCTKKMECARRHSESVWKKVKNSGRASFVRIAYEDLEAKKGAGQGQGDGFIAIQGDAKEMVKRLDRLLTEKLRKKLNT